VSVPGPARLLLAIDAVGGVSRSPVDFARELQCLGIETVLAGFGPEPDVDRRRACGKVAEVRWTGLLRDGMVSGRLDLAAVPDAVAELAAETGADAVPVNLPSQAAGLEPASAGCALVLSDIETYRELREGTALFASPVAMRRRCRAARASRSRRVPSARSSCAARARAPDVTAAAGLRAVV